MSWFKRQKPSIAEAATAGAGTSVVAAGALREFVYLDEVSVYSLTSSPDAPPPMTMSEAATASSDEVLKSEFGIGTPGFLKSGVSAQLNSGRSNGLQIQRQFNIQSQFASLHQLYSGSFALTASTAKSDLKKTNDLEQALRSLEEVRRAVKADELTRGTLAELRVELRAHSIFDVAVFIKAAGGLIDRHPELLPTVDVHSIRRMKDIGEFLNELMENLVPIEGRSTIYQRIVASDGTEWVADIGALTRIFAGPVQSAPLHIVGVAEQESFWKDTRRILHSDVEFDVLGRVSRPGLQTQWSPVKLTDAFDRVVPGVGTKLNEALNSLRQIATSSSNSDGATALALVALKFTEDLALHYGVEQPPLPESLLSSILQFAGGLEGQLALLSQVAESFYQQFEELTPEPELTARLRQEAWRTFQVITDLPDPAEGVDQPVAPETLAIELEFVAMYW